MVESGQERALWDGKDRDVNPWRTQPDDSGILTSPAWLTTSPQGARRSALHIVMSISLRRASLAGHTWDVPTGKSPAPANLASQPVSPSKRGPGARSSPAEAIKTLDSK